MDPPIEIPGSSEISQLEDWNYMLARENAFLKSFLQCCSPQMDGNCSWRWQGGWPMSEFRGPNRDEAVKNAMEAVEREDQKAAELPQYQNPT